MLAFLALASALISAGLKYAGDENSADVALVAFLVTMLLSTFAFAASSIKRLINRDLRLRPWLALRQAPLIFLGLFSLRFLLEVITETKYDWFRIFLFSITMTIFFSFSWTAYRRTLR